MQRNKHTFDEFNDQLLLGGGLRRDSLLPGKIGGRTRGERGRRDGISGGSLEVVMLDEHSVLVRGGRATFITRGLLMLRLMEPILVEGACRAWGLLGLGLLHYRRARRAVGRRSERSPTVISACAVPDGGGRGGGCSAQGPLRVSHQLDEIRGGHGHRSAEQVLSSRKAFPGGIREGGA